MEDDLGANLSLNLIPDDALPATSRKKKIKIHGDKRSRVKQRKELRQQTEDANKSQREPIPLSGNKRKYQEASYNTASSDKPNDAFSHNKEGAKKAKSSVVISSLFRKNPDVPVITHTEVEAVHETVFSGNAFKDLPLNPYLISKLEEKEGFTNLTEVQKRTIPVLLKGKDALVKSQTGSGKTVAYAVPIIQSLQARKIKVKRDDGPYALVIVPTRELALQSYGLFQRLLRSCIWIVPGCLMGGEKRKAEKARLRKGINILIATPGRLLDHIKATGGLSLARILWLVIDEADRLLELGYERDIAQIMNVLKSQCPDPPQTVLLSATLSPGVERLSSITLTDPEHINVSGDTSLQVASTSIMPKDAEPNLEKHSLPSRLQQHFLVTPCKLRLVTLAALILRKCKYSTPRSKMIIFFSTQDSVEFHAQLLEKVLCYKGNIQQKLSQLAAWNESDINPEEMMSSDDENDANSKENLQVFKLHGDMVQKQRSQTFQEFLTTDSGVLLCTDVASRGLDLPEVSWIVQYTSPGATIDYVHRVGRTARAGAIGHSLLFLMPSEVGYVEELNRHGISLSQFDQTTVLKCLLENIADLPKPDGSSSELHTPHTIEEAATYLQDRFEECVLNMKDMHGLAAKGFQSYIRAYATYSKEVKDIFKVNDLHLGHVAKSFALREAPAKIHGLATKYGSPQTSNKFKKKREEIPSKRPLSFKQATLSEYSSGFQKAQTNTKRIMAKPSGKMRAKIKKKQHGKRHG